MEKKICGASDFISHFFFSRMDERGEKKIDSGVITGTVDCNSEDNSRSKDILITGLSCLIWILLPLGAGQAALSTSSDWLLFTDIQQSVS